MAFRILASVVAVFLLLGFLLPYVWKMKEFALGLVILIGLAMMARDIWDTLTEKDE
jgi:hypothetical protein